MKRFRVRHEKMKEIKKRNTMEIMWLFNLWGKQNLTWNESTKLKHSSYEYNTKCLKCNRIREKKSFNFVILMALALAVAVAFVAMHIQNG